MKRLLVLLLCLAVWLGCFCGCNAKNEEVSSDSSLTNEEVEYFHTYEGEPLAHKKYTVYSTPRSSVKEGIANDPKSNVLAIKDATKLYFGFIMGCGIEQKPFTYIENKECFDDSIPSCQTVEYCGKKYVLDYTKTMAVTETYTFAGKECTFTVNYDTYGVWTENQTDRIGNLTIRRDTGAVVWFESDATHGTPTKDVIPISSEEAREKILQYVKDLCGEDVLEDYNVKSTEVKKSDGYSVNINYYTEGYKTKYFLNVRVADDGELLELYVDYVKDVFETVFEIYGKDAIDKAKSVLESAVDIPDSVQFYIAFDSDGKFFLVASTNQSYPQIEPVCDGVHRIYYAVEILPI